MKNINILTGPVQSGKTTRLIAWVKFHQHSSGILSPVIHNKRYLYSIHTNNYRKLEAESGELNEDDLVRIGKFVFLESTFSWGREQLQLSINSNSKYVIIDEIGPLELSGQGLEPVVTEIIQNREKILKKNLILVVRETLLDQVISHYNLEGFIQTDHNFLSTP